jgi:hypothetical protein
MQLSHSIKVVFYEGNSVSEKTNTASNLRIDVDIHVHKLPMCMYI